MEAPGALSVSVSSYYHLIFTALAFFISTIIFLFSRKSNKPKPSINLPPSPPGWPLVGNLFQVARSGKPFFQYVYDLVPKYRPIFTLRMGARTMIIVCSAELAHDALIADGIVFASRPKDYPTRNIFSNNNHTVNAAVYGPVWRSRRRNLVQNTLSSTRLKDFRGARVAAMDKMVDRLKAEAEANGGAVWVLKNARFAFFCILLSICFGLELNEKMIEEMDDMMKKVLLTLEPRIDDFFPILGVFFSKQRKNALDVRKEQVETLTPYIERRRLYLKNPESYPTAEPFSYLDTLLDMEDNEGKKSALTEPDIVSLCSEFLNGGTDTTGTSIEWAIARLLSDSQIQSKLYSEIRSTVGDRAVDESDIQKMPYLNAFTREVLRKHPPTHFLLTHAVTKSTTLGGYDVPEGVNVEFFLPPIHGDASIWSDPDRFDPERFLSGNMEVDITGGSAVTMLPFGGGRRICPGLAMATLHINLMLARMIQEFEWSAMGKIDFSEKFEFTVVMKNPLRAMIKPRGV